MTNELHGYTVHPAANAFPMMTDAELDDLAVDIKAHGLIYPIILTDDGKLADGRNRIEAAHRAGMDISNQYEELEDSLTEEQTIDRIASMNLKRRQMTKGQMTKAAVDLKKLYAEAAKERMLAGKADPPVDQPEGSKGDARDLAAAAVSKGSDKISGSTVDRAEKLESDAPDLYEKVTADQMTVNAATEELKARQAPTPAPAPPPAPAPAPKSRGKSRGKVNQSEVVDALNEWIDVGRTGRQELVDFVKERAGVKLSHGQLEPKVAELEAVRNAESVVIDWDSIPGNQQAKLTKAKESIRKELEREYRARCLAEASRYRDACDADLAERKAKLDADAEIERERRTAERRRYQEGIDVFKARGLITPSDYNLIRKCLHPDTRNGGGATPEDMQLAFQLFSDSKMKTLLVKEK